jgi:hypothetical protein
MTKAFMCGKFGEGKGADSEIPTIVWVSSGDWCVTLKTNWEIEMVIKESVSSLQSQSQSASPVVRFVSETVTHTTHTRTRARHSYQLHR